MSNNPGDLQALFANIKPRTPSGTASPAVDNYQQRVQHQNYPPGHSHPAAGLFHYLPPTVSSPLVSPPTNGTPPHHGSDIISPNVPSPQPQPGLTTDRTNQLLNLLRFNPQQSNPTTPRPEEDSSGPGAAMAAGSQPSHTRGISASDLIASFMPKPTAEPTGTVPGPPQRPGQGSTERQPSALASGSGDAAQEMLLRLLNRPKASTAQPVNVQGGVTETSQPSPPAEVPTEPATSTPGPSLVKEHPDKIASPSRTFGAGESVNTKFEAPKPTKPMKPPQGSIFTYTNPFEQLAAVSPRPKSGQGVKPEGVQGSTALPLHRVKHTESPPKMEPESEPVAIASEAVPEAPEKVSTPAEKASTAAEVEGKAKRETVPEVLEEVAEKVDMEAEAALARAAAEKTALAKQDEDAKRDGSKATPSQSTKIAIHLKKDVGEKDANGGVKPTNVFQSHADKAKEAPKRAANGKLADSWEDSDRFVPVYSFPIKPFVSITWKKEEESEVPIRDDGILNIAKLKKPFDQLDRSLTSATSEYIVYALAKNGGMRVIRQEDGHDRRVFHSSGDRVFHVALCRAASSQAAKDQAVLGTGVSGAVYWAPITKGDNNLFEKDALDSESLIFPPHPASDENTSGGQLKTRVRRSSRNPDFFAIGRGKSIHIVWPQSAMSARYGVTASEREVQTEKFFKEKCPKIATGKAGKDFAFSDDDTVIVSLDKTGRMRFWDIHQITEAAGSASPKGAEIRVPLLTLATGSPNEKSWPTSVLFLDKMRPFTKKCALRYVLVGLKQNHTLQLWDLGLGKAVQEINFPHTNESDAICSVAYHASSGIIVVGHPTRNSIYFIHLSTPKYNLPPMSQAAYIQGVAEKDPKVPRPECTACMSGIRELSFNNGNLGELRSLELLPLAKSTPPPEPSNTESPALFELYVMHSRGVTCLTITKADLGWSFDNKIIHAVDSLGKGLIDIKGLQSFPMQPDDQSVSGDAPNAPSVNGKEKEGAPATEMSRNQSPVKDAKRKVPESIAGSLDQTPSSAEKPEKKKKKKAATVETPTKVKEGVEETKFAKETTAERPVSQEPETGPSPPTTITSVPADSSIAEVFRKEVKKVETAVSLEFTKSFNRELDALYHRFDEDRRANDEAATARQDAVLRLISSTLSDNVEKNLSRIISSNVKSTIVPALVNVTTASMDKQINEILTQHLESVVPRSINTVLSDVVSRTLKSSDMKKSMSDVIAPAIVSRVENDVGGLLREKVMPSFKEECVRTAEKMTRDAEQRLAAKMKQFEAQKAKDNAKLDQLTDLVRTLTSTVASMATNQSALQNEITALTSQLEAQSNAPPESSVAVAPAAPVDQRSPEEVELSEISQLMSNGKYEDASIRVSYAALNAFISFILMSLNSGSSPLSNQNFSTVSSSTTTRHISPSSRRLLLSP